MSIPKKYIYILSQRYSGSTLLSFLLGTHPSISTIGERRKFYGKSIRPNEHSKTRCSCGELFLECDYWNTIKNRLLKKLDKNDLATNFTEFKIYKNKYANTALTKILKLELLTDARFFHQLFSKKINDLCRANQLLVEEILDMENTNVFLDSSKIINHALFLSQMQKFDFYVIWLTRDPRAQVSSALKYNQWSIREATRRWKKEMETNRKFLEKMKLNHLVLRYESLCSQPEKEMIRILDFVGLDPSEFSLDFRQQTQHIMGNYSMRLGKDTKIVERKDWQQRLSADEISTIEKLTKDHQQYYSV